MLKVLIVSDSAYLHTGYSTITKNLCRVLKDEFEMRVFATIPHKTNEPYPFTYISSGNHNLDFRGCLKHYKPDVVITLLDLWRLDFVVKAKQDNPFIWLAYLAVEGEDFPKSVFNFGKKIMTLEYLGLIDYLVTYSQFGKKEIEKLDIKVDNVIPLGVDTDTFKPKEIDRQAVIKQVFKRDDNPFIFLFVGDNQIRKRLDLLLMGWSRFQKEDKGKSILLLLTDPVSEIGFDIPELKKRYKIESTVYHRDATTKIQGIEEPDLIIMYNLCDCYVMVSGGEGFGLPYLEASACGKPIIMPDYATPKEIFTQAIRLPITKYLNYSTNYTWGAIDIKDLARAMDFIKNEGHTIQDVSQYDWKNLKDKWIVAINEAYTQKSKVGVFV